MNIFAEIGPYLGLIFTLGVLTFVVKENVFYRFIEFTFIGVSAGYGTVLGAKSIIDRSWSPLVQSADYIQIIVLLLGVLYIARISEKLAYISRWPAALVTGVGLGVTISGIMASDIVKQSIDTMQLVTTPNMLANVSNFLILIFVTSALFYYVFTLELKPPYDSIARIGKLVYMATFGAAIAFEIQGRTANLIARFVEMLSTLGLI